MISKFRPFHQSQATRPLIHFCAWIVGLLPISPLAAAVLQVQEGQSIQAIVEQAVSGDEIVVEPGEYREHIYIEGLQNVTIRSLAGPDQTRMIIPIGADYAFQARFCRDLTISGFTIVSAEGRTACSDLTGGIYYVDSSGIVENCDIDLFTGPEKNSPCFRHGIVMQTWISPDTLTLEIRDCNIRGFRNNGVFAYGNRRQVKVFRNRIEGAGTSADMVQYGLLLRYFATAVVEGNVVTRLAYGTDSSTAAGVLAYGADTAKSRVHFNNFADNQAAIISLNSSGLNLSSPPLSAEDNYWGHPSGPGGNSEGVGDPEFGAAFTSIWDTTHAYDPETGQDWSVQTSEGRMVGARFLPPGNLYPQPETPPYLRSPQFEYHVDHLPYLGSPVLHIKTDTLLSPVTAFYEFSLIDKLDSPPQWHAIPVVAFDSRTRFSIPFGTQGPLGNEAQSWIALGALATSPPKIEQAAFDPITNIFHLVWTGEPGHLFRIEGASPQPTSDFLPIAQVQLERPVGIFTGPIPYAPDSFYLRVLDLGPTEPMPYPQVEMRMRSRPQAVVSDRPSGIVIP